MELPRNIARNIEFKKAAKLIGEGKIDEGLSQNPTLTDLASFAKRKANGDYWPSLTTGLNAMAGIPQMSTREEQILAEWSAYPQIQRLLPQLAGAGLGRDQLISIVRDLINRPVTPEQ